MPAESAITTLGWRLLGELPPFLRSSYDIRAVQHAYAKEIERLESRIEEAREQAIPTAATLLLGRWERMLGLPVAPAGLSEAERRQVIRAFMGSLASDPSGTHWWAVMRLLVASGMIALEHESGVSPGPAPNEIHVVLPFGQFAPMYGIASRLLRRITPAHVALTVSATEGLLEDSGKWDVGKFE